MTNRAASFTQADGRVLTPKDVADSRMRANRAIAILRAKTYGDPKYDARFKPMDAKGFVYIVGFDNYVKIGFSVRPKYRISDLQIGLPVPLVIHAIFEGTKISEKQIQARYKEFHLRGEWFRLKGRLRSFVKYRKATQSKTLDQIEEDAWT